MIAPAVPRRTLISLCLAWIVLGGPPASSAWAQNRFSELNDQIQQAHDAGQYSVAEKKAREYLALARQRGNGPLITIGCYHLGRALDGQQKFAEAEGHFQEALQLAQEHVKPLVRHILRSLAANQEARGRFPDAERTYRAAIARYEADLGPDHADLWQPIYELAGLCATLRRFEEARSLYGRCRDVLAKQDPPQPEPQVNVLDALGRLHDMQDDYVEAVRFYREALTLAERVYGADHSTSVTILGHLGNTYAHQENFAEAERLLQRALASLVRLHGPDHDEVGHMQQQLAGMYKKQGRYAEAELLYRRTLETRERLLGPSHPDVGHTLMGLGLLYSGQRRGGEALPLLRRALDNMLKVYPPDHPEILKLYANIGTVCCALERDEEAEQAFQKGLTIAGEDSLQGAALFLYGLAILYREQKRFDEAEALLKRCIEIQTKFGNVYGFKQYMSAEHDQLARLYFDTQRYDLARKYYDLSIGRYEQSTSSPGDLAMSYAKRAQVAWAQERLDDAKVDLSRAMQLSENQRVEFSGGELERSSAFGSGFSLIFEHMVRLQTKLADLGEALAAMERGRARSLMDQMSAQGIDLLQGVPAVEADKLRQRQSQATGRIARIEKQLEALAERREAAEEQKDRQQQELLTQLHAARREYATVQADMRNASPAYRLAVGKNLQPASLGELQAYAARQRSLLLRYLIGVQGSYLLVIPPEGASRLVTLEVTEEQARQLGIEAGPLTGHRLQAVFAKDEGSGVMQLLRQSHRAGMERKLAQPLAALWELLIPEAERTQLVQGKYQQLMVIPDGALSLFPFEALVVEPGEDPRYLLDVGPPIVYAPSATILYNLAERPAAAVKSVAAEVLSVGDPTYDNSATQASAGDRGARSDLSARARYRSFGGLLSRLPYTAWETTWIEQVFSQQGLSVDKLVRERATEANVRAQMAGRQIIHLACHGLTDQSYGNLFGALALTPGNRQNLDRGNDGYLTLAEIYGMRINDCELAILSACDTNYGPQQQGEGVWALSRGFLVAGARRVVASNWVVDDQAGATLVSYFATYLSRAGKDATARDYAKALHDAKKQVRKEDKWASPFYWSSLVLVGPK